MRMSISRANEFKETLDLATWASNTEQKNDFTIIFVNDDTYNALEWDKIKEQANPDNKDEVVLAEIYWDYNEEMITTCNLWYNKKALDALDIKY